MRALAVVCALGVVAGCSGATGGDDGSAGRDGGSGVDGAVRDDASIDAGFSDDVVTILDDGAVVHVDADLDAFVAPADDAWSPPGNDAWTPGCDPAFDCAGRECGMVLDGCGNAHACGTCPSATTCDGMRCVSSCIPSMMATTDGGGLCGDLHEAYTARGINVGYYAFRVRAPIEMYSGDFDGAAGTLFMRGPTRAGVQLQTIPAGAYVGLSSSGPWYDPPSGDCSPAGQSCGDPGRAACGSTTPPPMRPARAGFVWGYAYQGASHMQGWIPADFTRLVYAGHDPSHPCALGPAGADFEVPSACGAPNECAGTNSTCAATNPCDEGSDDCGRTACGAMSGGVLTPSAWHRTVAAPASHACTMRTPPDPSVRCFANGSDPDFFFVYPFGAYLYWAQNSTTKAWLHYGDHVQAYFHTRDAQGVLWDFVEVTQSGAPTLTPASDGAGAATMQPCLHGGTCGWVQDVFLE